MKKHLLFYFIFFSYLNIHASGWGNDVLVRQGEPQGSISAAGKSTGLSYAAVPDNIFDTAYSVVIYRSLDFGATWAQFSGAGPGGFIASKTKMVKSGLDSIYLFYMINNTIYTLNVESGNAGIWDNEPVRDFDVAAAQDGSLFLVVDILTTNQIRRFGSFDGAASWGGNSAVITANGASPKIYMSGTSDTLIVNYYGPVAADTATSTIIAERYVNTSPGSLTSIASSLMDVVTNTGVDRKEFKTVFNNGTAWFFYTEGNTVQELKYKVSTNGGFNYGPENILASGPNINHHWFDATHSVLGFIGDGVSITWYADSIQGGTPTMQSDKIVFTEASNAVPYSFSTPENISEHPPEFSSANYKPVLVNFDIGSADERGILWTGLDGANLNIYWDLLSFIPTTIGDDLICENSITLFPNPAADELIIALNNLDRKELNIEIKDITGKIVNHLHTGFYSDKIKINVSDFKPGIYLVNIKNNSGVITKKFVLSR